MSELYMGLPLTPSRSLAMLFHRYQSTQNLIGLRASRAIGSLWTSMVDPDHFSDSWRRLEPIVKGIIDTHYQMSAADASQYYGLSRAVAGFYGNNVRSSNLDASYLSGFTKTMGVGQFFHFLDGGHVAADASRMAIRALQGASVRVVMNGGRDTVTRSATNDDVALGWERISEPRSCSFCARHAASGGIRKAADDTFPAHDRCQCLARVVFKGQSSANADLASQWARVTSGKSGKDAEAAWDQYWSGRNGSIKESSEVGSAVQTNAAEAGTRDAAVPGQSVGLT
jgi:hypothetical protein